jgi:hypothetical protein
VEMPGSFTDEVRAVVNIARIAGSRGNDHKDAAMAGTTSSPIAVAEGRL